MFCEQLLLNGLTSESTIQQIRQYLIDTQYGSAKLDLIIEHFELEQSGDLLPSEWRRMRVEMAQYALQNAAEYRIFWKIKFAEYSMSYPLLSRIARESLVHAQNSVCCERI